jgi:hypothetical protein
MNSTKYHAQIPRKALAKQIWFRFPFGWSPQPFSVARMTHPSGRISDWEGTFILPRRQRADRIPLSLGMRTKRRDCIDAFVYTDPGILGRDN